MTRSDPGGTGTSQSQRSICYSSYFGAADPPPPPPPYNPANHIAITAAFNSGILTGTLLPCSAVFPVLSVSMTFSIQFTKTGGATGSALFTTDNASPFDCAPGFGTSTTTGPLTLTPLPITHDQDLDGCTDWNELGSSQVTGGLRDPFNMWDYMNPSFNDTNRTKDVSAVVAHFGHDASPPGDPLYGARYDRGGSVPGAKPWNLLPPNGTIRGADITAAVNSFGHDCPAPPYTGIGYLHGPILDGVYTGIAPVDPFRMGASPSVDWPNGFPISGQAHIGDELVSYTRDGPTFYISAGGRGQGGTTATSHPAGTLVWFP